MLVRRKGMGACFKLNSTGVPVDCGASGNFFTGSCWVPGGCAGSAAELYGAQAGQKIADMAGSIPSPKTAQVPTPEQLASGVDAASAQKVVDQIIGESITQTQAQVQDFMSTLPTVDYDNPAGVVFANLPGSTNYSTLVLVAGGVLVALLVASKVMGR